MEDARTLRCTVSPLHLATGVPPLAILYPASLLSSLGVWCSWCCGMVFGLESADLFCLGVRWVRYMSSYLGR